MNGLIKNIIGKILKKCLRVTLSEGVEVKYCTGESSLHGPTKFVYGKTYEVRIYFDGELITKSYIFKDE